jgi:myxalamid-type polyketide synthase MxaB
MGWSTGGIFAYEIARRLANEELPVQALVMIDTPLPVVFQDVDLQDHAKFLVDLIEFANYFAGTSMELNYEELKRQDNGQAIARVLSLGIEHRVLPPSATGEYLERLINVCKRHVEFLQTYKPPMCGLAIELLRPEDTGMLSEATGQSYADDLGWSEFAQLRVHQVPGHHFTMMTGTNAPVLADKIEELLGEAALESRGV